MSIKIEDTEVFGWRKAIKGARNAMNSWEKSDSVFDICFDAERDTNPWGYMINGDYKEVEDVTDFIISPNDHKLLMNLCKGGTEESKWRRMVHVQMDVTAPLYWWKEFETYKVGTVSNSCSTMHKIHAKEFTLDDFSCEHRFDLEEMNFDKIKSNPELKVDISQNDMTWTYGHICRVLNSCREKFLETKDKKYWWQMIQLLPTSYNQRRTIDLNYEVLAAQYRQRKDHKLDCWHQYCDWIRTLPYSEFITMEETK